MKIEKIDYVAKENAIDDITYRTAQNQGKSETEQPVPCATRQKCADDDDRDSAMAINRPRCQPAALARKLNAAPLLCVSTRLKKLLTTRTSP